MLSIPPFSKKVKGWTIRQVPAPGKETASLSSVHQCLQKLLVTFCYFRARRPFQGWRCLEVPIWFIVDGFQYNLRISVLPCQRFSFFLFGGCGPLNAATICDLCVIDKNMNAKWWFPRGSPVERMVSAILPRFFPLVSNGVPMIQHGTDDTEAQIVH